jgi:hypothetical protein
MILSSHNLVRKIGVCITSEETGESKLTSEENVFNNLLHKQSTTYLLILVLGLLSYFELNKISISRNFLYFGLHITKFSSKVSCE